MTFSIVIMVGRGYFLPTHVHEASEKNVEKYKSIIEQLYPKVKDADELDEPLPEIFTRLAGIRTEEGKPREALRLYDTARDFLAQRIQYTAFFGDLSIMKRMICDIYRLRDFDPETMDLYDLYYLLQTPRKVRFTYDEEPHEVKSVSEAGGLSIRFDRRRYHSVDDFFNKAELDGEKLTYLYDDLYDFHII